MSWIDIVLIILIVAKVFGWITLGWGAIIGIVVAKWVVVLLLFVLGATCYALTDKK